MKRMLIGAVAAGMIILAGGTTAGAAEAPPQAGADAVAPVVLNADATFGGVVGLDVVNTFRNEATNRCIDDSSAGFRTWSCNTSNYQRWNVHVWGDGTRQLKNLATGRCIDDSTGGGLRTWTCWPGSDTRSKNQSWIVHRWGDGTIRFQNEATGRCMDDSGNGFRPLACNSSQNQSWY